MTLLLLKEGLEQSDAVLRQTFKVLPQRRQGRICFLVNGQIVCRQHAQILGDSVSALGRGPVDSQEPIAATLNGAKVLRVDEITGSLESGKSADLLVIDGNPLKNIRELTVDTMSVIMKEGEFIRRTI